jgi:hypothetical protein
MYTCADTGKSTGTIADDVTIRTRRLFVCDSSDEFRLDLLAAAGHQGDVGQIGNLPG